MENKMHRPVSTFNSELKLKDSMLFKLKIRDFIFHFNQVHIKQKIRIILPLSISVKKSVK